MTQQGMNDMPLTPEDEAAAQNFLNSILAAFSMSRMGGIQLSTYKGLLNGEEVLILAAIEPQGDGNFQSKPLALIWNDAVHHAVGIPHATKVE